MSWRDPLDVLPLAPPPPPPSGPRPALRALAAGIALLLVAGVAVVVVRSTGRDAVDHPDEWDPRVSDLVAFVEQARGLEFEHPVHVDLLTPEAYRDQATAGEDDLTAADRDALSRDTGLLRALGVASGPVDLFEALNAVTDGGTLAFYDPEDRRIRVRGTELTVGVRVTLVHELTHALQDQAFDLRRLDDLEDAESAAFRALVEGDALRVEEAYAQEALDPDERAAYERERDAEIDSSEAATAEVPPFLSASFAAPYLLGGPFVTMLVNRGGNDAVDEAFEDPPTTEEHLFDPASHLAGERAAAVDLRRPEGADDVEASPFGAPSWFLVLAERIDPFIAFEATLGWGGDASHTFERDGRRCVRAAFVGDTVRDTEEMAGALDAWAATMPDGVVERFDDGPTAGFESCDPGPDVELDPIGRGPDLLVLPSLWGYLVADAASVADADTARCYARGVLGELTFEEIADPEGAIFTSDAFQQAMQAAFQACR
ncbi:MAG: hypothetical protein ACO1PW_11735 [Actinomycetota bacterium]